jgi:hypothetical protein
MKQLFIGLDERESNQTGNGSKVLSAAWNTTVQKRKPATPEFLENP